MNKGHRWGWLGVLGMLCAMPLGASAHASHHPVRHSIQHVSPPSARRSYGPVVLMYHHLLERENSMNVRPEVFDRQMAWIHDQGYHVVSSDVLVNAMAHHQLLPPKTVVLTFDDGWHEQVHAMEVLDRYHFPASFALITMFLDRPHSAYITIHDVQRFAADDFIYLNHSHSHDVRDFYAHPEQDVARSTRELATFGTRPYPYYVYPYGLRSPALESALRQHGYTAAFGVWDMPVDTLHGDMFNINRFLITDALSFADFQAIVRHSG